MSIKIVEEVPVSVQEKRKSYREMIRQDIKAAIEAHVECFEFDGDYNYKYLAAYAKEEASKIFRYEIYVPAARLVKRYLEDMYDLKYAVVDDAYKYDKKYIDIISQKEADRIHVYCKINYEFASNFHGTLLEASEKLYRKEDEVWY